MTPMPSDEVRKKRSPSDFIFGKLIGEGSFSTVYLAKDVHTSKEYAVKILRKIHIKRENKLEYVTREKNILLLLSDCNNFFVKLFCTFQDTDHLYFVLTYAKHGDLLEFINHKLSSESVRFYAAEMILALEMLNNRKIIHRDFKPENILIDENFHILLTDFGSAKVVTNQEVNSDVEDSNRKRKNSFVGTAQYVTPEMLTSHEVSYASDLWALGCTIYQMIAGTAPFQAGSEYLIFKQILSLNYEFPDSFNEEAKDLVQKLLIIKPEDRLGAADVQPYISIREHNFFAGLNWNNLGDPPRLKDVKADNSATYSMGPGFDEQKASRLQMDVICPPQTTPVRKKSEANRNIADLSEPEIERRLEIQQCDKWHLLVEGNLILKQGLIDKRKGLFPRRRMLLLTRGPHLYYVDPSTMVLKGEIPWSAELKPEAKTFKVFHVHTPNRIYYLEDPEGYALDWCKAIEDVKSYYYPSSSSSTQ